MRRAAFAVALAFSACTTPASSGDTASPNASASDAFGTRESAEGQIPDGLLGTYDTDAAACGEMTTMTRLTVSRDSLRFYYGYATVDEVAASDGGYDVGATLYHLEGAVEVVPQDVTYRIERTESGVRFESGYGGASSLVRCPPGQGRGEEPASDAEGVQSAYTEIAGCETIESFEEGGGLVQRCPGYQGTPLYVSEGDLRYDVDAGVRNGAFETPSGFNELGKTVEWRLRDGQPFAVIARYTTDGPGGTPAERRSELAVIKVGQQDAPGCLVGYVAADASPSQNAAARRLADREAEAFSCDA